MEQERLAALRRLSDAELVARLRSGAGRERAATTEVVAHLAELDRRYLHLREGYGSLFVYCREVLALSEHEAYNRIEAARAARRFPAILEMLKGGSLNSTTLRLLAPHLTAENHRSVLESARCKGRMEVEQLVAQLAPWPEAPDFIRKLQTPGLIGAPGQSAPWSQSLKVGVVPLARERYRVQVTVGAETIEKLRLAKDMLRHVLPSGDGAALFERALTALLKDLARTRFAATDKPRSARTTAPDSRHVPAEVKRAVWLRDLGRCAFVASSGRRCAERGFVEFHHVKPYAVGGEATLENIELRCRRHNHYEAKTYFRRELEAATAPDGKPG